MNVILRFSFVSLNPLSRYKLLHQQNSILADHQIASHKHHPFLIFVAPAYPKDKQENKIWLYFIETKIPSTYLLEYFTGLFSSTFPSLSCRP
jgi:hypothetical protein